MPSVSAVWRGFSEPPHWSQTPNSGPSHYTGDKDSGFHGEKTNCFFKIIEISVPKMRSTDTGICMLQYSVFHRLVHLFVSSIFLK